MKNIYCIPIIAVTLLAQALPAAVAAEYFSTPTRCPADTAPATFDEGKTNRAEICNKMNTWDIARIGAVGSISGRGYGCAVLAEDKRPLGATICKQVSKAAPPVRPVPPAAAGPCTVRGCGVKEPQFAAGSWGRHDCSGLMTTALKTHCEQRNARMAGVEGKCAHLRGKKAYNACLSSNDPPVYDSFHFSNVDFLNCESSISTACRNQVPDWMLFASGGKGQVQSCESTPRSASCTAQMRLYKLCGDNIFASGYYVEECLLRARKAN